MALDAYRFFRIEARELIDGLGQETRALDGGAPAREPVGRMLRLAHTLKGAARVVRQTGIADSAHRTEDLLVPFRDSDDAVPQACRDGLLALIDAMAAQLRALDAPPAAPSPAAAPAPTPTAPTATAPATPEEPLRSLRIDIDALDDILDGVAQARVSLEALGKGIGSIKESLALAAGLAAGPTPARTRALAERLKSALGQLHDGLAVAAERTSRDLERADDTARRLRLIPAGTIFPALDRTARDAAEQLGKAVDFEGTGGAVQLDAHVLGGLRDALVQIVRNAVAHGIEAEADRLGAGKPARGRIAVQVERRGHKVVFRCRDDGGGLDLAAVREAVSRRGRGQPADKAAAMSLDEAVALVFRGGLSTARTVTAFSGRGVGLELVREVVQRLKGELTATTEAGGGTVVEIGVPVSLASMTVLRVEAGGLTVSLPLDAVRRAARTQASATAPSALGDALLFAPILFDGEAIPFLHLPSLLRHTTGGAAPTPTLVVVEAQGARAAVGVDRLGGAATIFMRRLPAVCGAIPWIAGASFDEEGNPRLVLDPAGLVAAAHDGQGIMPPAAAPERPRLLVVDDSLTTRMLEQSILETAGYDVDLAASGEEGLDKARERPPALFIVDVEMPGIDGYEFIRRIRRDPALRAVPAIMVTSLASDEDRRRAGEAGAQDCIIKSEFDEGRLLERIHQLIGPQAAEDRAKD